MVNIQIVPWNLYDKVLNFLPSLAQRLTQLHFNDIYSETKRKKIIRATSVFEIAYHNLYNLLGEFKLTLKSSLCFSIRQHIA